MRGGGGPQGYGPDDAIVIEAWSSLDGIPRENQALAQLLATAQQTWQKETQALVQQGDRQYDLITVRFANGTRREVWFNITSFFGGFGAALFGSAQADSPQPTLPPFPREIEDDIAEAVVRHQVRANRGEVAFLHYTRPGAESSDPSDVYLARFAGNRPRIRKGSDSEIRGQAAEVPRRSLWQRLLEKAPFRSSPSLYESLSHVGDRTTGKAGGTKLRIGEIRRVADDRADVAGGWYAGSLAAWDGIYHLRREEGRWVIYNETTIAEL